MQFNSFSFLVFLALVLAVHNSPLSWRGRKFNLLIASYLFYAAWNPPFVRLPTTGNLWDIDEFHYPRAQYWDVFSRQTRTPTLHFQDVPSLAAFECPDGSHLDAKDRHAFTEALLDEFVQRGWLTPPSP